MNESKNAIAWACSDDITIAYRSILQLFGKAATIKKPSDRQTSGNRMAIRLAGYG
ncbi:hypothetical protein JOY44_19095 [Phormidium sp. CLA17]|uniref:hypothetical protein n=1 Tax=Leptolyngbya sp. Cla-17 TaxID=2803751 RepID=UPI0019311A2C|nr:hypothetical protein [Leptolyngbya sp. Cla-17]MBM0743696.1 hypothetical protein [Leptolyngbya sp. Cla-17]